jgi:hypothetical protein
MGWQGLTALVPASWHIGMIGGDKQEGHLRLDDDKMPRLMIKWSTSETAVALSSKVNDYLNELGKRARKRKEPLEVNRKVHVVGKRSKGKGDVQAYAWRGECQSYGAAWHCPDCHRVVMAEVMGPVEADTKRLAREVLRSLEDHPRDGWTEWRAYGLEFAVPERYELARSKFMSALLEFELTDDTERIAVHRWGIAETVLRDTTLRDWAAPHLRKRLKEFTFDVEETEVRGHPALTARGEKTHLSDRLRRLGRRLTDKYFADACLCRVWHCENSNRLYYLECLLDQERLALADEVLERLPCHETENDAPNEKPHKGLHRP